MSKHSRIQAQAADIEWRRWMDEETYYPLRDDARAVNQHGRPRQYAARWVIDTKSVAKALTDGQIAVAGILRDLRRLTVQRSYTRFEFFDSGFDPICKEARRLEKLGPQRALAGFRAVAQRIPTGAPCFEGIIDEDSLAQLQRRCGMDRDHRGAIDLVCTVLRACELYHGFNAADVEHWNART